MKKYNEFCEYYCKQPEIVEWIDRGVDVIDTFATDDGREFFVWEETRNAYQSWIEEQTK